GTATRRHRSTALAAVACRAEFREAAHAPRGACAEPADAIQPADLCRDLSSRPGGLQDTPAARRVRTDPPLRQRLHRAVGTPGAQVRSRGQTGRVVLELAVHRAAARALLDRRTQASR